MSGCYGRHRQARWLRSFRNPSRAKGADGYRNATVLGSFDGRTVPSICGAESLRPAGLGVTNFEDCGEPSVTAARTPKIDLKAQGFQTNAAIAWNLVTAPLVEEAVRNGEGLLAKDGPLVVETGNRTGRSAQDKFTVQDAETEGNVWFTKGNK